PPNDARTSSGTRIWALSLIMFPTSSSSLGTVRRGRVRSVSRICHMRARRPGWNTVGVHGTDAGIPPFRILGSLEILDDGQAVRLRSHLQRLLLTILLLEANRVVRADWLIDELWGDQLPDDPPGALRTHIARLRRHLPPVARLVTETHG